MTTLGSLEEETCRDYVVPRLQDAGWSSDQIIEQYPVTHGRIVVARGKHRRGDPLRADYLLEVAPGFSVGVVEAKREYRIPSDGLQQAMRYAELLDLPLAYATNGKGIVEHDFDTGAQTDLAAFPAPSEAWARFRAWKGITDDGAAELLHGERVDSAPHQAFARRIEWLAGPQRGKSCTSTLRPSATKVHQFCVAGRRPDYPGADDRETTERTVDGHHRSPPCAVGVPVEFRSRAICRRLLPAACSALM